MDSIIARQKIGKRRRSPPPSSPKPRALDRVELRDRFGEGFPLTLPRAPARGPWKPLRRGGRALGDLALALRRRLRAFASFASGLPRTKLALGAIGLLAGIAALCALIAALARGPTFPLPPSGLLPAEDSAQSLLLDYVSPELANVGGEAESGGATLPPAPVTLEYSTYTIRPGDSLASIAKRFGLYMDTIVSANGISSASSVRPGTQLRIPNINGLIHRLRPGDSLASISKRYKADTTRIVDANDLGSSRLLSGQSLFIPGARLPEAILKQALGQKVAWPLRGSLSSYFGYRPDPFTGIRRFHAGIDIVANSGSPVRAAMDGRVADVGYNGNYGNYIILSHADGYQTLYGHLTQASVQVGATVEQGSVIGISGNTGYSTGPHLHFGLFRRSLPLNPLKFLLK